MEMTAQMKKQQARIQYLESMVEKLNKEVLLMVFIYWALKTCTLEKILT